MDMIALPLASLTKELVSRQIRYTITYTRPNKATFTLLDDNLYVLRQKQDAEGVYHLVIAAKMGKDVR